MGSPALVDTDPLPPPAVYALSPAFLPMTAILRALSGLNGSKPLSFFSNTVVIALIFRASCLCSGVLTLLLMQILFRHHQKYTGISYLLEVVPLRKNATQTSSMRSMVVLPASMAVLTSSSLKVRRWVSAHQVRARAPATSSGMRPSQTRPSPKIVACLDIVLRVSSFSHAQSPLIRL